MQAIILNFTDGHLHQPPLKKMVDFSDDAYDMQICTVANCRDVDIMRSGWCVRKQGHQTIGLQFARQ